MSGADPLGRDVRRGRAARRLPIDAACVMCGERDPEVLAERPSVLEAHHVAGRANDPDLIAVLCLNCHRRASSIGPAFGLELERTQVAETPERLVAVLNGLAAFFAQLAQALRAWARWITTLTTDLDDHDDEWRSRQRRFDG